MTFDEFKKAEIKIGTILSAEKVPDADKLIKLMIDLGPMPALPTGEEMQEGIEGAGESEKLIETEKNEMDSGKDIRQILSGISAYYPDPSVLIGKQVPVLTNLPVRTIRGLESQGMVLYAVGEGFLTTVGPDHGIPNGTIVR